jgi:hypothetical protein
VKRELYSGGMDDMALLRTLGETVHSLLQQLTEAWTKQWPVLIQVEVLDWHGREWRKELQETIECGLHTQG